MRGGAEIGPRHVDVCCVWPCAYDESRAVRGVWAYNRVV